jgi:hypothetical protein
MNGIFFGIFGDFCLFVSILDGKPEVKTQPHEKLVRYSQRYVQYPSFSIIWSPKDKNLML